MVKNMIFLITKMHFRIKKLRTLKKGSNFCLITPFEWVLVVYFKTFLEITMR